MKRGVKSPLKYADPAFTVGFCLQYGCMVGKLQKDLSSVPAIRGCAAVVVSDRCKDE